MRGTRYQGELRLLRSDGAPIHAAGSLTRVRDEAGVEWRVAVFAEAAEHRGEDTRGRQAAIGRVANDAAIRLLEAEEWEEVFPDLLAELSRAAGASGACLFEAETAGGRTELKHRIECSAAPPREEAASEALKDVPTLPEVRATWETVLQRGDPAQVSTAALPMPARRHFSAHGVHALVLLPVQAGGAPWGLLAMEARAREGGWSPEEVDALHEVAGVFGAAIQRRRALTSQGRSQQQVRQSQRLDAVGQLAGGVAHDFNNLLMVIRGNLDLLLMDTGPEDAAREELEQIRAAAERASSLTRQLLAFSRLQVLAPEILDLNRRMPELLRMLTGILEKHVELVLEPGDGVLPVKVDPGQLEQIILNLVVNARDAMPQGGTITVRTERVEITAADAQRYPYAVRPGSYVQLVVSDTGHGMDEATMTRLFEPFFTTKPRGKGTGLGLPMVYGIVKQSGGYVWVDSEPGAGSTFRICLPAVRSPEPEDRPAAHVDVLPGGGGTVLLVEDEAAVRTLARRILERGGYQVLEAHDGPDALRVSERHTGAIDLLITDVVMPGMNGSEVAHRLGRLRPEMKVLLMSGHTVDRLALNGVAEEGIPFLQKPFDQPALLGTVKRLLS